MNLSIKIAGIRFKHPFLLASAPPTRNGEMIMRAFAEGWAGAVTKTITRDGTASPHPRLTTARGEARNYFLENIELLSDAGIGQWLRWIEEIRANFEEPVIASIMAPADCPKEWAELAEAVIQAGARGVELNVSCPHGMPERAAGAFIGQDQALTGEITAAVREAVDAPVWVKLTPNVTDIVSIGRAAVEAGADCLAAINTLSGIAGVDIETMSPLPAVKGMTAFGGISGPGIKPVALRCVAQLAGLSKPVSGMGGITDWRDAVEFFLLGAGTAQICTAVMYRGYSIIYELTARLEAYLERKGFDSFAEIVGLARERVVDFDSLPMKSRVAYEVGPECSFCGDCIVACRDGGYQAIYAEKGKAVIDQKKCDGCGLCEVVCSTGAIKIVKN